MDGDADGNIRGSLFLRFSVLPGIRPTGRLVEHWILAEYGTRVCYVHFVVDEGVQRVRGAVE